ncbi:cysteine-rich CWC family protein [Pseudomonas stutzeri]|nr:cysteine-rich CWC family protein [Stutzerimonas stutzeri]MCQ4319506.1 cysteine-rich CWC family protein [Stutzerimonas stutzeri]
MPTQVAFQRSASRCPVCGEPNSCGLSNPATATRPCWCFSIEIAPEARDQIPDDTLNKACICPRCACGELPAKP